MRAVRRLLCAVSSGLWTLSFGLGLNAARRAASADIVYTVGTTTRDSHGRDWAYILWQGVEPSLVSNRVFAVYAKPGDATNNAPLHPSVAGHAANRPTRHRAAAGTRGQRGRRHDETGPGHRQLFGSFIPPTSVTRADQLSAVIRGSMGTPEFYQDLLLLARNHPGVDLALGFADAELIGPGLTTFEVRAFDPVTGRDLAVIGRVTVEAGNPTVLPAPGPPVLVPVPNPMGDLNLKFRWGTPDNLRRLGLMQFGFNLYRVEMNYAERPRLERRHAAAGRCVARTRRDQPRCGQASQRRSHHPLRPVHARRSGESGAADRRHQHVVHHGRRRSRPARLHQLRVGPTARSFTTTSPDATCWAATASFRPACSPQFATGCRPCRPPAWKWSTITNMILSP